jgi:outer membrane protein assembly factor BamA
MRRAGAIAVATWLTLTGGSRDAAALGASEGAEQATVAAPSLSYAAFPLVGYSSDTGVGLGVRGVMQRAPSSVEGQAFATTDGAQFHFLFLDVRRLAGSSFRLDALAGYRRDPSAAYYGIGNHPVPASGLPDALDSYSEETPVLRIRLRRPIWGDLSALAGYRFLLQHVSYDPASLLATQSPLGVKGGNYGEVSLGLAWDTRDDEMDPSRGWLVEATVRGTAPASGSRYTSAGAFASASAYREILPALVVAGRAAVDGAWGDVPFDRLQDFGSLVAPFFQLSGIGGALTVRGLRQSEYVGHAKAVANVELRWRFAVLHVLSRDVRLSSVAFADAGRVWEQGPDQVPFLDSVHAGAGGGLRIAWGKLVVLRADAGYAEGGVRVYADFRHVF